MQAPSRHTAARIWWILTAVALPAVHPLAPQSAGALASSVSARIDSVATAELAATQTPGAALVIVQGDRVVYARGYGVASVETKQPVAPEFLFRLGSTTKMMTSLAALSLAARGVVDLDRPIGTYAPSIGSARLRGVTLRQLLSHTAGLLDYTSMAGPHDDEALMSFVPTLTDTVFFAQPGDIFSYSNLGYAVAGYVLGQAAGKPYAAVMHDEVFAPLGMARSTIRPIEAMTWPLAQGHERAGDDGMRIIRPAPDDSRYWPAGSAFTSVLDFSRLAIAMMNEGRLEGRQVLPASLVRTWLTPVARVASDTSGTPTRYGFGLETSTRHGESVVEHSGSRGGYGSLFRMVPSKRLAIIVLGNQTAIYLRKTLDAATSALAPELVSAAEAARPVPVALTASEVRSLAGSYRNSRSNGFDLVEANGSLFLRRAQNSSDRGGSPVQRIGTGWFTAGATRFAIVTGADGTTKYLMSGLRAMRKGT